MLPYQPANRTGKGWEGDGRGEAATMITCIQYSAGLKDDASIATLSLSSTIPAFHLRRRCGGRCCRLTLVDRAVTRPGHVRVGKRSVLLLALRHPGSRLCGQLLQGSLDSIILGSKSKSKGKSKSSHPQLSYRVRYFAQFRVYLRTSYASNVGAGQARPGRPPRLSPWFVSTTKTA